MCGAKNKAFTVLGPKGGMGPRLLNLGHGKRRMPHRSSGLFVPKVIGFQPSLLGPACGEPACWEPVSSNLVQLRPGQARIPQVATLQMGLAQVRLAEIGAIETTAAQVGPAQVGAIEQGKAQVGLAQVGPTQVGELIQTGAKISLHQPGLAPAAFGGQHPSSRRGAKGAAEISPLQPRTGEIRLVPIGEWCPQAG